MCDLSILYLNLTSAVTVGDESCGLIQYLEIKDSTKKFNSENPPKLNSHSKWSILSIKIVGYTVNKKIFKYLVCERSIIIYEKQIYTHPPIGITREPSSKRTYFLCCLSGNAWIVSDLSGCLCGMQTSSAANISRDKL